MIKKEKKYSVVPSEEKAMLVLEWLYEKQGRDLVLMNVQGLTAVTDHVIVATAKNARHAQGLSDHILDMCGENKFEYLGMEGFKTGEWILVDLNDVVVHIFQGNLRTYYNIEGLWSESERIDHKFHEEGESGK